MPRRSHHGHSGGFIPPPPGATGGCDLTAASASLSDVQAAVDAASAGQTVCIPAGDSTWTAMLTITKGITLKGAGTGTAGASNQTTIRDNVTKDGSASSRLIHVSVDTPQTVRLTNFNLVGVATDPSVFNQGHIAIDGTCRAFRIDHLTVTEPQTSVIRADGALWGVIDHITLTGGRLLLQAGHGAWAGSSYGDGSWADALYWGTEKAIYVEDCTLVANGDPFTQNFLDGLDGCRVVYRHNDFTQGNVATHGTETGGRRRSIRSLELYSNTFTFPVGMAVDFIVWMRGGTGVIFNNTVTCPGGLNHLVKHNNERDTASYAPWGICDGTSVYDQNSVGGTGYLCVDQPGTGTSNDLGGAASPPSAWVGNTSDPIYVWGNIINGSADNCATFGCTDSGHVVVGRDLIDNGTTAKPGYTAYPYPHALNV